LKQFYDNHLILKYNLGILTRYQIKTRIPDGRGCGEKLQCGEAPIHLGSVQAQTPQTKHMFKIIPKTGWRVDIIWNKLYCHFYHIVYYKNIIY